MESEMYKMQEEKVKMAIRKEVGLGGLFKGYNIDEALSYALKYVDEINPQFGNYEKWGGDCTNYISQCLFAGGIPFDFQGIDVRYHWYWFSEAKRTPSWTAANSLKFYMENNNTNNDGSLAMGLKAAPISLGQLLRGDLVQLIDSNGYAYHSMIVTGYVTQEGRVIDYLISQHSGYDEDDIGRVKNFPLSKKVGSKLYWSILGYIQEEK